MRPRLKSIDRLGLDRHAHTDQRPLPVVSVTSQPSSQPIGKIGASARATARRTDRLAVDEHAREVAVAAGLARRPDGVLRTVDQQTRGPANSCPAHDAQLTNTSGTCTDRIARYDVRHAATAKAGSTAALCRSIERKRGQLQDTGARDAAGSPATGRVGCRSACPCPARRPQGTPAAVMRPDDRGDCPPSVMPRALAITPARAPAPPHPPRPAAPGAACRRPARCGTPACRPPS